MEEQIQEENNETQELYEHYRFKVDAGQGLLRIDKFLYNRIENISRSKIQNAARAGNIFVNNTAIKPNYKVKPADDIAILLPTPVREIELIPEDIPLVIVYEDKDLIIVDKKAGMVVHPAYANYTGTLLNALFFHFGRQTDSENLPVKPWMVHRIDKNTSGLLIIAKNELSQALLAKQFYYHTIDRLYLTLVWGDFEENEGTINVNIGRNPKNRKVMTTFYDGETGKNAITHYKVIERFRYVTLLECRLETGRTHQIRTHLKSIGHPVFNDAEYGGNEILKGTTFTKYKQFVKNCFALCNRQALHAKTLGFIHPSTSEKLFFSSEIPSDMFALIEKWRNYTKTMGNE